MLEAVEEKYLNDQVNKYDKHASTVSKKRAKGFGDISDNLKLLDILPAEKKESKWAFTSGKPGL